MAVVGDLQRVAVILRQARAAGRDHNVARLITARRAADHAERRSVEAVDDLARFCGSRPFVGGADHARLVHQVEHELFIVTGEAVRDLRPELREDFSRPRFVFAVCDQPVLIVVLHVDDREHPPIQHAVDDLVYAVEPRLLDVEIFVDVLEPGDGDAHAGEAQLFDERDQLFRRFRVAPAGLRVLRLGDLPRLERVAEIPSAPERLREAHRRRVGLSRCVKHDNARRDADAKGERRDPRQHAVDRRFPAGPLFVTVAVVQAFHPSFHAFLS